MLDGVGTKQLFSLKMRNGTGIKKLFINSIYRQGCLFLMEMLDGAGIEKAFLTQYVRRGWHEKALFRENIRWG